MVQWMGIINLTPDSFHEPSRVDAGGFVSRVRSFIAAGASFIDIGAVSTRPGAKDITVAEEWARLEPALRQIPLIGGEVRYSIDTTRSEIVRRVYELIGPFVVNDISSGEDDPFMLPLVARLGLTYIAMHKRGNPRTMGSMCYYPQGIMPELLSYFGSFAAEASVLGIQDWILDPGLGFAKTPAQCWEILERLGELKRFGRPILIGAADKRFTRTERFADGTAEAHRLAIANGADILRVHEI